MRKLTPYERTHLLRFKPQLLASVELGEFGEKPVEYITGRVEFAGLVLRVNQSVLIPRVETEELVELTWLSISKKLPSHKKIMVVEVGTGSGAIGLALWRRAVLQGHANIVFTLIDVSLDALLVAKQNYADLRQQLKTVTTTNTNTWPKLRFVAGDLLGQWQLGNEITVIVANLPYIPTNRIKTLDPSVRDFEPLLALDGGQDGLTQIHSLLSQAKQHLAKDGVSWLEIDDSHNAAMIVAQDITEPKWACQDIVDSFGKMRFARCVLTKKSKKNSQKSHV